jgi:hypothetical protein
MSVGDFHGDQPLNAFEPGRRIPEPITEDRAEPLSAFPAAAPPVGKPFRLHPEWAQRGPFW